MQWWQQYFLFLVINFSKNERCIRLILRELHFGHTIPEESSMSYPFYLRPLVYIIQVDLLVKILRNEDAIILQMLTVE